MLLEQFFHTGFPQECSLAIFNVRTYGATNKKEAMDIIKRHFRPNGTVVHHLQYVFTVPGTCLLVRQVVLFIVFDTPPTIAVLDDLAKTLAADRPIISATHCRSWTLSAIQPAPTMGPIDLVLSDAEARAIGTQNPDIQTRSWMGRDKEGRAILRTAIVSSTVEVEARSPGHSDGEGEGDDTPAAGGPATATVDPASGAMAP
jgi:hypothetical protein